MARTVLLLAALMCVIGTVLSTRAGEDRIAAVRRLHQQHNYHQPTPETDAAAATATVYYDSTSRTYSIKYGVIDKTGGVAYGSFADSLNTTGWGVLNVVTNAAAGDEQQMFGAGYLEGALTNQRIYESSENMHSNFFGGPHTPPPQALINWFQSNEYFLEMMIEQYANQGTAPINRYWTHIGLIFSQFQGLIAGYQAAAPANQPLQDIDFSIVNGVGDLLDLMNVIAPEMGVQRPNWLHMKPAHFKQMVAKRSLCSALVKITPTFDEIYSGHSAWFTYSAMNRIYKFYTLSVSTNPATKTMSFSSYPGMLESLDDFYVMDSGLTMLQTTISVFNNTLYNSVTPESLLAWQRVRLANWLATSGEEWYNYFEQYNSGTYNNEYMVINYNLFTPGQPLPDNTLWVIEQIPTLVQGADLTNVLAAGYWPSYNVPYFEAVYNMSGYPEIVAKYGTQYSYELAPRAQIFRRDQATVVDMASFQALLRYNDYKHDPISAGDPMAAICSRGDVIGQYGGCYDTKVTSSKLAAAMTSYALNGPTQSHGLLPFQWTSQNQNQAAHFGEPSIYNFGFVEMTPAQF